ncbi:hypothetical protein CW696_03415 [ANME-2 cluster archaeon]|nr:MAG: hypothetical protein CW696_03415 [ANME-2 cluster archaeon]
MDTPTLWKVVSSSYHPNNVRCRACHGGGNGHEADQPSPGDLWDFIGKEGPSGRGTAVVPIDGAFDEQAEEFDSTIDTTGLEMGDHAAIITTGPVEVWLLLTLLRKRGSLKH